MARIKTGKDISKKDVDISFFEADFNGSIIDMLIINNNKDVLIKEIIGCDLSYSFFRRENGEKIEISERLYSEENKEIETKLFGGYNILTSICVNKRTGLEMAKDVIFKNNIKVFESKRERYPEKSPHDIFDIYKLQENEDIRSESLENNFVAEFKRSSFGEKINLLRGEFRSKWRANCELGFENPEYFLRKELYKKLLFDPDFKSAIREVLIREEKFIDVPSEEILLSIEKHYESD